MTVAVVVICDAPAGPYGMCPTRTIVGATDVDAARAIAHSQGWMTTREGKDRCPSCSGRRP